MTKALALGVLLLTACGPHISSRAIRGPDGQTWYAIRCGGDPTVCYERAGEACPGGYDVADQSSQAGTNVANFGGSIFVRPTFAGQMLVKCHGVAAPSATARQCRDDNDCAPGCCVPAGGLHVCEERCPE